MADFNRVKQILDESVNGETFAAHGPFWRSLTRDQFVAKIVFGKKLIHKNADGTFDAHESNLVRALEGRAPFGNDMVPPAPGALWPRMPFDYPPVPDDRILEIRHWITAGCPESISPPPTLIDSEAGGALADPTLHNAFFRDFDNWAMFMADPQTVDDINAYFAAADEYFAFATDPGAEPDWATALLNSDVVAAVQRLEQRQRETVISHYGSPVPLLTLLDAYIRFGDNSLPDDPLRPVDVRHNMNGQSMWFFWAGFGDACVRLSLTTGISSEFWFGMSRAILVGLLNDGLFRGRFTVTGFTPDADGKAAVLNHVQGISDSDLQNELISRLRDSGILS